MSTITIWLVKSYLSSRSHYIILVVKSTLKLDESGEDFM